MSKRIKKVFSNHDQVLHLWANQSQTDARCKNVFFNEKSCWSYGYHYELGRLIDVKVKGKTRRVAIINSRGYSVTTNKHISSAYHACLGNVPVLKSSGANVFDIDSAILENKDRLVTELFDIFCGLSFHRHYDRNDRSFDGRFRYLNEELNRYNEFCVAAGRKDDCLVIPKHFKTLVMEHVNSRIAIKEHRESIANTPEELERKAKLAEKREALKNASIAEKIERWKKGGQLPKEVRFIRPQLIRIKGNQVETTSGAQVPLVDAKRLFERVIKGIAKAGDAVGSFTFNAIEGDLVKIGCHTISLNEAKSVFSA